MEILAGIAIFIVAIAITVGMLAPLIAINCVIQGYVLKVTWGWFIVPLFHLPSLTVAQAIGIGLVFDILKYHGRSSSETEKTKEEKKRQMIQAYADLLVFPLIILGVGWIVHQFV